MWLDSKLQDAVSSFDFCHWSTTYQCIERILNNSIKREVLPSRLVSVHAEVNAVNRNTTGIIFERCPDLEGYVAEEYLGLETTGGWTLELEGAITDLGSWFELTKTTDVADEVERSSNWRRRPNRCPPPPPTRASLVLPITAPGWRQLCPSARTYQTTIPVCPAPDSAINTCRPQRATWHLLVRRPCKACLSRRLLRHSLRRSAANSKTTRTSPVSLTFSSPPPPLFQGPVTERPSHFRVAGGRSRRAASIDGAQELRGNSALDQLPAYRRPARVTDTALLLQLEELSVRFGAGMTGRGKREIPEKTRRPTASSGTILTCENPVIRPGIKPGSPWWEASVLIAQPQRSLNAKIREGANCPHLNPCDALGRTEIPCVGEGGQEDVMQQGTSMLLKKGTSPVGRKAVQCWDTGIGCAQAARSVSLIFNLWCGQRCSELVLPTEAFNTSRPFRSRVDEERLGLRGVDCPIRVTDTRGRKRESPEETQFPPRSPHGKPLFKNLPPAGRDSEAQQTLQQFSEVSLFSVDHGVAVAEWLACSPPTKANRDYSPAGSTPDFRIRESCRTIPLVGGCSRVSPVRPAPIFRRCSIPQSPSPALKTSLLRAAQISSLTRSLTLSNTTTRHTLFSKVYTEVTFATGSQFIRHAQDDSEPIADLQGYDCVKRCDLVSSAKMTSDEIENLKIIHTVTCSLLLIPRERVEVKDSRYMVAVAAEIHDRRRAVREVTSGREVCDCEYQAVKGAACRLYYWTICHLVIYSARLPTAQPIRNLSEHAVANQTQGMFPEPRAANERYIKGTGTPSPSVARGGSRWAHGTVLMRAHVRLRADRPVLRSLLGQGGTRTGWKSSTAAPPAGLLQPITHKRVCIGLPLPFCAAIAASFRDASTLPDPFAGEKGTRDTHHLPPTLLIRFFYKQD
ncbi:hypothetical protein PR048_014201 [Dryococelus australis]|uniref:Uncharacterized protein n=1 Tax=Dryococelus australis TaxID=614101 RepID=A0ABQ9HDJ3_9NEOP|nr:hypothetical protein PR048_014201 [Dryococelus australis]